MHALIMHQLLSHHYVATCDPANLGDNPTSVNNSGTAITSNGVITYNGVVVNSTAFLNCNDGFLPETNSSIKRTCLCNGNWSGEVQTCLPAQDLTSCKYL